MGLLDSISGALPDFYSSDQDKAAAQKMGLLNFAGAMLASRGNFGQALGQGLLYGSNGYQDAIKENQRAALGKLQLDEAQRKATVQKGMQQAAQDSLLSPEQVSLLGGGGPTITNAAKIPTSAPQFDTKAFLSRMWAIDPIQALSIQQSLAKESPFGKVDPKDYTPESIAKFAQTRNFADLTPARKMEVGPGGQVYNPYSIQAGQTLADPNKPFAIGANGALVPNAPYQQYEIGKARAGSTKVSIGNIGTQESEQSKAYGKTLGDIRSGITSAAFSAPGQMAKLNRIEELLKGVDSGSTTALQLAQAANSVGLKIDPKLGVKEAAESLSREFAGGLRPAGSGPMTDKDFENYLTQVPSLSKSAEGRAQIIATTRAKLARDIEIGRMAREYAKKNNGVIDDGFMDIVSDYVAQNPVVQRESTSGRVDAFPDQSAIDAELARRKGKR